MTCYLGHDKEVVVKSIKALNHEEHEGLEGKEKLFVFFVVPFFSGTFATISKVVSIGHSFIYTTSLFIAC